MAIVVYPVDADGITHLPSYAGRALRQAQSAFMAGATSARPFGVTSGVRPGTSTTTVTATSTTWTMGLHAGILDMESAVECGPYAYAVNTAQTGAVTAAHATLPRIDIVWVRLDDPTEADGSALVAVVAGYTAGTAASTPAAPATPARCMVLAQISVPASGGGAPTVIWKAPYAVAAGADAPARTRELAVTISGTLAAALDLATAQTITASPFGTGASYSLRVAASVGATVGAGLGVQIDIMLDGAVIASNKQTNAGTSACTQTVDVVRTVTISDTASHIIRAVTTPLGGSVTLLADATRYFEIQAFARQAL